MTRNELCTCVFSSCLSLTAAMLISASAAAEPPLPAAEPPSPATAPVAAAANAPQWPVRVLAHDLVLGASVEDELRAAGYTIEDGRSINSVQVALYRTADGVHAVLARAHHYCGEAVIGASAHGGIGDEAASSLRVAEAVRVLLAGPCRGGVKARPKEPPTATGATGASRKPRAAARQPERMTGAAERQWEREWAPSRRRYPKGRLEFMALIDTFFILPMVGLGTGISGYLSEHARLGVALRYGYFVTGHEDRGHMLELQPSLDWTFAPQADMSFTLGFGVSNRLFLTVKAPAEPRIGPPDCCDFSPDTMLLVGPRVRPGLLFRGRSPVRYAATMHAGFDYGIWRDHGIWGPPLVPAFGLDFRVGFDLGLPPKGLPGEQMPAEEWAAVARE